MEAYEEVDEINMEAWPENNSHITDTDTIAGVENEAKAKTVKMKKLLITQSLMMGKSWHDKALEIVILL